jgi:hypothetical protein
MTGVVLGFVPEPLMVPLDKILPSRKVPVGLATSRKYNQIRASIEEVGLIEPLSVAAMDAAPASTCCSMATCAWSRWAIWATRPRRA